MVRVVSSSSPQQEAQLNDVLFELDRRAAKLLLKPLDVDFVGS